MERKGTGKAEQAQAARERLLTWIGDRPQRELYVTVRSVSRDGTSRVMAVYLPYVDPDGRMGIWDVSGSVADLLGWRYRSRGVSVGGVGMDMGSHLVSTVAHILYGDEDAIACRWLP